jgi:hypothetical protein
VVAVEQSVNCGETEFGAGQDKPFFMHRLDQVRNRHLGQLFPEFNQGKSGFLIPPADKRALPEKVCQLIKNKQLREEFGKNIRQSVKENFDWDNIVEKWIEEVTSLK